MWKIKHKKTLNDSDCVNENLKNIRTAKGLTLQDVSKKVGVSVAFLSAVETGRKKPSNTLFENLCVIYDVDKSKVLCKKAELKIVWK